MIPDFADNFPAPVVRACSIYSAFFMLYSMIVLMEHRDKGDVEWILTDMLNIVEDLSCVYLVSVC